MPLGAALQAHHLRKSYDGVVALESFDLEVQQGKVVGFLGPNGAGKTTVIRILSTLLSPDSGNFSVAGIPRTRPVDIRRRLGVLPESAGYPAGQTGVDWLTYHGRLYGRSRGDARAAASRLLDEVGLGERGNTRIATYSRGMRQLLGIARALVNDPDVVFLDEPTLGLDPGGQVRVLELVTDMARLRGVGVVLSTHVLAEVEHVCDEVVILNRGRKVAEGTVTEVVNRTAAPRCWVLRVPPQLRDRGISSLSAAGFGVVAHPGGDRGSIELAVPAGVAPEQIAARALGCLSDSGVSALSLGLDQGRLSDSFLALIEASDG